MTTRLAAMAISVLLLAGCKDQPAEQASENVSETLSAQSIGGNDTTAIDAVTNDAANLAADWRSRGRGRSWRWPSCGRAVPDAADGNAAAENSSED